MSSLHVVPWAARALLALPGLPRKQVWVVFWHHLVCAPVAGEILSLCLVVREPNPNQATRPPGPREAQGADH